jgi:hypothetical protein
MKIYISSTYRDLAAHRKAVADTLRRMGHQIVGMEDYVAEGGRPLARCLADVDDCDVLVGIIAWRYGFVPEEGSEDPGLGNATDGRTSITEYEYGAALARGKPTLMFLLDPDAEWPANQFDALAPDGDGGKAIAQLRREIERARLVSYFRTPDALAGLVSAAVYREEMGRRMRADSLNVDARINTMGIEKGPDVIYDTSVRMIVDILTGPEELQALRVDIGRGRTWWMSRLYFLASLAADLSEIEAVVFVDEAKRFVGMANPRVIMERIAKQHDRIGAYERALRKEMANTRHLQGPAGNLESEISSRVDTWNTTWTPTGKAREGEAHSPAYVTKSALGRWLGPYMITEAIHWDATENSALQMQRLIDWPMRFVPVVGSIVGTKGGDVRGEDEGLERFERLVDKRALTEQIARLFVREQVARALSTVR